MKTVHVFGHDALATGEDLPPSDLTTAEERAFADLLSPIGRMAHLRSRALLRLALTALTGGEPTEKRWRGGTGDVPRHADLRISLAHSRAVTLVAISSASSVGVDVERTRPLSLAVKSRLGCRHLSDAAFLDVWCARESCIKAVEGSLTAIGSPGFVPGIRGRWCGAGWATLTLGADLHGAVALRGNDPPSHVVLRWLNLEERSAAKEIRSGGA